MSKKAVSQCGSRWIQRYGTSRQGKPRWYCPSCRRTLVWKNVLNRHRQRRVWFERWIMEGDTVRQRAAQSGYSPRTLHRIIAHWLHQPPPLAGEFSAARHLILDGTFLDRRKGVFAVMDATRFAVVYAAPEMAEGPAPLQPFCTTLAHHGFTPFSATVDGNWHVIRILRQVWPTIVIQRCLVHIQRQGLSWCRQSSKRPSTARLVSPRHGDPHRGRAGSVRRSGAGVGGAIRAAPGTPGLSQHLVHTQGA